jgi:CBS domain-containing protein
MWMLRTLLWICGGTLRGLAVRDAMLTKVIAIPAHVALSELTAGRLLRGGLLSRPVVRGTEVVGLLSVQDVLAVSPEERERTSVQAVMMPLRTGIVVGPGEPLLDVAARMLKSGVDQLVVVENGRLEGLLRATSLVWRARLRSAFSHP